MSGVYRDEGWTEYISSRPGTSVLNFTFAEGTNSFCSPEALKAIRDALRRQNTAFPTLFWTDTGDYHYIAGIICSEIREAFALALFDNHSDEGADSGRMLSCGNWVSWLKDGNPLLEAVVRNPAPSDADSLEAGLPIYISVDLDVLSPEFARTNWNQGTMTPLQLLTAIDALADSHRIAGIDICGGLTASKGALPEDLEANLTLRTFILDRLEKTLEKNICRFK